MSGSVSGRFQADVRPLGFATVQALAPGYRQSVVADSLGRYTLSDLPAGPLQLRISHPGHEERTLEVLVPAGRYARMGNVWFIPSCEELLNWLVKTGFRDADVVDVSVTTSAEQRATQWMRFQSLADFLNPGDSTKTLEGYPAPRRAVLTAIAP